MIDLNDLRVFDGVATLKSFSAAARALGMPNSSVSRSIKRLEATVGTRLVQRTTREVGLTAAGNLFHLRCADLRDRFNEAIEAVGELNGEPRGELRVSVGIGWGYSVLLKLLPDFLDRYPAITVTIDLTSRIVDLVAERVDVTIRMGPLRDSTLVARRLGTVQRHLCGAPAYLERRGTPGSPAELLNHNTIEMLGVDGKPRNWVFSSGTGERFDIEIEPRLRVNDPVVIHKLVLDGAGLGCIPDHLCAEDIDAGRLIRLLPALETPPIEVSAVFPSSRAMSPAVRAFVDMLVAGTTNRATEAS